MTDRYILSDAWLPVVLDMVRAWYEAECRMAKWLGQPEPAMPWPLDPDGPGAP